MALPIGCQAKHVQLNSGKVFDVVFVPTVGSEEELNYAAYLSSMADKSDESSAIYFGSSMKEENASAIDASRFELVPPREGDSMSGINLPHRMFRKGPIESIDEWISRAGGMIHNQTRRIVSQIIRRGHQAIVVADDEHDLGVIELIC